MMRNEKEFFVTIIKNKELCHFFYCFDIKDIRENEK